MKLIGKGRISSVYTDDIYAYKVFDVLYDKTWVQKEVKIMNEISNKTEFELGDVKLVNSHAIQMKYFQGMTLAQRIKKHGYKNGLDDFIELQSKVFNYHLLNLEDAFLCYKDEISKSKLDHTLKDLALKSLNQIPYEQTLCHFDFHFENIMYDGSYHIIDWVNAKLGNKVMDIARTYIILVQYAKKLSDRYLNKITRKLNINVQDVYNAIPLMGALRLHEMDSKTFNNDLQQMICDYSKKAE